MRLLLLRPASAIRAATLLLASMTTSANVQLEFIAQSPADEWDTRTYRGIWEEYGERIVASLERRTCMPFAERNVAAVVAEDVSHSGGPQHPMQLRASYIRDAKQSTLVHELGHRHLWQLAERLEELDGHRTLFLVLDRVWADVWGEEFAAQRVRGESSWQGSYDYAAAWTWARALEPPERARLWNELLAMNGFPDGCNGLFDESDA